MTEPLIDRIGHFPSCPKLPRRPPNARTVTSTSGHSFSASDRKNRAPAFKEGDGQPQGKLTFLLLSSPLALSITYDHSLPGFANYQGQLKEQCKVDGSKTYVLKFDMHCQCNGCIKKINDGVKEISLSDEGVERADLLIETGEVKVSGRMDPEKLRSLLHAVTKKCVEIVTQSTLSKGHTAASPQNKNVYVQV